MLSLILERSAVEQARIGKELAEKGLYAPALYHLAVAVRLRMHAILSLLGVHSHICSIPATATLLEAKLERVYGERLPLDRKLLACLEQVYRAYGGSCVSRRVFDDALKLFNLLGDILCAVRSGFLSQEKS